MSLKYELLHHAFYILRAYWLKLFDMDWICLNVISDRLYVIFLITYKLVLDHPSFFDEFWELSLDWRFAWIFKCY
jgi:hypothetical protein